MTQEEWDNLREETKDCAAGDWGSYRGTLRYIVDEEPECELILMASAPSLRAEVLRLRAWLEEIKNTPDHNTDIACMCYFALRGDDVEEDEE